MSRLRDSVPLEMAAALLAISEVTEFCCATDWAILEASSSSSVMALAALATDSEAEA